MPKVERSLIQVETASKSRIQPILVRRIIWWPTLYEATCQNNIAGIIGFAIITLPFGKDINGSVSASVRDVVSQIWPIVEKTADFAGVSPEILLEGK